ncbi:MAG TPA: PQQ-dependent sugar dehydrogenase [Dongiaceae bacterium]|nr:PQQ-dependent sugar dehydrogenase [Dongiaceae bacterium]
MGFDAACKSAKLVASFVKKLSAKNRRWIFALAVGGLVFSANAKPYGLDTRPQVGPFLNGAMPETAPAISGNWSAVVAFTNLAFTNAVGLTFVPNSNQLCVLEREGRVWTFENSPDVAQKKLILDIHDQCQGWDDSGLLGVAFHPGFATNHFVFVYYTAVKSGTVVGDPNTRPNPVLPNTYHDRLSRFTLDENGIAIPNSETILIDQTNQTVWHDGGGMFFHPQNGFLYLTIGDNSVGDNDQIINKSLYSGVFRIDVDCRGGNISHPIPRQPLNGVTTNYFIPNDNPFVGQSNVLEEFFCLGLRSPHRMTIDPPTGRIFIGDVGESMREEIDVIETNESALNFQWNKIEGNQGHLTPPFIGIDRPPVLDYPHSDGRAVIGGYVYRGKKFASDLGGRYIFGDNVMRTVWAMDETTTPVQKNLLCVMPKGEGPNSGTDYTGLSSFGTDVDGEIYFCQMSSIGGRIYTLQRGGPPPPTHPIPKLLSQTGAFADLKNMTPQNFLIPYSVNSPLWSDGAAKSRWMALPENSQIHFASTGEWKFPAGTVFVKNFELPVDDTNPKILRRLETRLLVRDTNGAVYGASYKWRADNSDADLVTAGITEQIKIKTSTGERIQNWFFPGRQDCLTCHTPQSGGVLGVKTRQLNGDFKYPNGVTDNQLRAWNHARLFDTALDEKEIPRFAKLVSITNPAAPLELRARSYLDANCAQCHRPGGVEAFFDARFDTPLKIQNLINGPVANQFGLPGSKVIVPGDTNKSILFRRISLIGNLQMPPLAKNVVDEKAAAVIAQWINSLTPASAALPKNWSHMDIGSIGLKGKADYLNGQFNLLASGADIWENADAFHFACTPLDGDGQIVARVASMQYTDPWAKAGVMFRENLSPGSRHASMLVTAQGGSAFQWRAAENDSTGSTDGPATILPRWMKLVRAGNVFTGYISADGESWQRVDDVTNSMPKKIYVGIAVTAHNNSALNSTLFDNVKVVP